MHPRNENEENEAFNIMGPHNRIKYYIHLHIHLLIHMKQWVCVKKWVVLYFFIVITVVVFIINYEYCFVSYYFNVTKKGQNKKRENNADRNFNVIKNSHTMYVMKVLIVRVYVNVKGCPKLCV